MNKSTLMTWWIGISAFTVPFAQGISIDISMSDAFRIWLALGLLHAAVIPLAIFVSLNAEF